MEKALAVLLLVAVAGCAALGLMLRSAQAEKDTALADKAKLSVVVDAQRSVINTMQADAEIRDRALADRDKTITMLNTAAFDAVSAIGRVQDDEICSLDNPLPDALAAPLRLLHSQAGNSHGPADSPGDNPAIPVPAPANARGSLPDDNPQSRTVDGAAAGVGR
ncbi:MAG: hypothetical protein LBR82_00205 [Desulfovibrio sp.]|jgi:hypothetical protein|nr:hypothetical protein [Desulfovibrio sp.]